MKITITALIRVAMTERLSVLSGNELEKPDRPLRPVGFE
jgi:hypothetical protein